MLDTDQNMGATPARITIRRGSAHGWLRMASHRRHRVMPQHFRAASTLYASRDRISLFAISAAKPVQPGLIWIKAGHPAVTIVTGPE
jgi:hypothetical protein